MVAAFPDPTLDLPVRERPIDGYHEAHWVFGYDPAIRFGYYLYLLADRDSPVRRTETAMLFLPDGTTRTATGGGDATLPPVVAGRDLAFRCERPLERWTVRYAGERSELNLTLDAAAPPWNTEGADGEVPPAYRYHQLNRVTGSATLDGHALPIGGTAMRSRSFRRRDTAPRGHVIATALFPDGRCFGLFCYVNGDGQRLSGHGYVGSASRLEHRDVIALPGTGDRDIAIRLRGADGQEDRIEGNIVAMAERTFDRDGGKRDGTYEDAAAALISASGFCVWYWAGTTGHGPLDRSRPVAPSC